MSLLLHLPLGVFSPRPREGERRAFTCSPRPTSGASSTAATHRMHSRRTRDRPSTYSIRAAPKSSQAGRLQDLVNGGGPEPGRFRCRSVSVAPLWPFHDLFSRFPSLPLMEESAKAMVKHKRSARSGGPVGLLLKKRRTFGTSFNRQPAIGILDQWQVAVADVERRSTRMC